MTYGSQPSSLSFSNEVGLSMADKTGQVGGMPRCIFSVCSPSPLTATLLRTYFHTSPVSTPAAALYLHPRGGFLPFVGGFSSWRTRSLSCSSFKLVAIAFVVPPAAYPRDDPPLGFSSSHVPHTSFLSSPCLLELRVVANPHAGLLSSS